MDNNSETSESQSIDINSININNYVPNDCESLPIDIDEIATRGRESEWEMVGERDRDRKQWNDKSGRAKKRKTDRENEKEKETEREWEGSEKERKKKKRKEKKREESVSEKVTVKKEMRAY